MLGTKQKVFIARLIQSVVMFVRRSFRLPPTDEFKRNGLLWRLDLREGIDFSIWLLGSFEPETLRSYSRIVKAGDVVLDIGANVGAHTLPLSRLVGDAGLVIAFEPTDYAFLKLQQNLSGNKNIVKRVRCLQVMLGDQSEGAHPPAALYSSWPLNMDKDLHPEHRGRLMTTNGAVATTLDAVLAELNLERLDCVKLDIDGFECQMLRGAHSTLLKWHPTIIMELAPYVLEEQGASIEELLELLAKYGYSIFSLDGNSRLAADPKKLRKLIPQGSSLNVVAKIE